MYTRGGRRRSPARAGLRGRTGPGGVVDAGPALNPPSMGVLTPEPQALHNIAMERSSNARLCRSPPAISPHGGEPILDLRCRVTARCQKRPSLRETGAAPPAWGQLIVTAI